MTTVANKTQQNRNKLPSVTGRSKSVTRKTLKQYKADQRIALDKFKRQCGG